MRIVDLDDDRNCFCGDDGDYERWNIDTEAIIEIVRCKNCKHYDTHDHRCKVWNHGVILMGFCYKGEREEQ